MFRRARICAPEPAAIVEMTSGVTVAAAAAAPTTAVELEVVVVTATVKFPDASFELVGSLPRVLVDASEVESAVEFVDASPTEQSASPSEETSVQSGSSPVQSPSSEDTSPVQSPSSEDISPVQSPSEDASPAQSADESTPVHSEVVLLAEALVEVDAHAVVPVELVEAEISVQSPVLLVEAATPVQSRHVPVVFVEAVPTEVALASVHVAVEEVVEFAPAVHVDVDVPVPAATAAAAAALALAFLAFLAFLDFFPAAAAAPVLHVLVVVAAVEFDVVPAPTSVEVELSLQIIVPVAEVQFETAMPAPIEVELAVSALVAVPALVTSVACRCLFLRAINEASER